MMKKLRVKDLVLFSILAAMSAVLRIFVIQIYATSSRIIIYNIPIMIAGLIFGPLYGGLVGIISDVSSMAYYPGWNIYYVLISSLWGIIPGILRYFFNYKKVSRMFLIEIITHVIISIVNTLYLIPYIGLEGALGKITTKPLVLSISLFGKMFEIINLGETFYLRILAVILVMIIKIPIDVLIINAINKRVIMPLNID